MQESSISGQIEKPQNKKSIEEFQKEYVASLQYTHSKKYLSLINLSFKKLLEFCGNKDLRDLDTILMQRFINHTFGRAKRSAALYNRTLKAAFNRSMDWGHISENPFRKVKLPRMEKTFPIFISEDQLKKVLTKVDNEKFKKIFITAFYTGMRLGEIVNLKWRAINMTEKLIVVMNDSNFTTKSKKERVIPISEKLFPILAELKMSENSKDDYVFGKFGNVLLCQDYVSRKFKDAVIAAELDERVHFHTLRHSFASNLVQKGASLYIVKELLGHESITTTQIYSHLRTEDLRASINLLDR